LLDKFCGEVATVWEEALADQTLVGEFWLDVGGYGLAFAELNQSPFGFLAVGMIKFGSVDAGEADVHLIYDDSVAIDNPAWTLDDVGGHRLGSRPG
jgi:hypothetical protein